MLIKDKNFEKTSLNILLTGATGFLGAHLLDELISSTKASVYCLVRGEERSISKNRLLKILNFYFSGKHERFIDDRIIVLNGDVSLNRFGLTEMEYLELGQKIDMVIHSAALVKHYGNYSDFEKVNVLGTKEVIEFAQNHNIRLGHISTISVSGHYLTSKINREVIFTEDDFYIGQNYMDNVYVRSKFEAENLVFKAIDSGLNAVIFRIGNLTGRYSDGHFQINIEQNAFYNRIRSIIKLGVIPEEILGHEVEFTPVDYCSKAIIEILKRDEVPRRVFHVFNHNTIKVQNILNMFEDLGYRISAVSINKFREYIMNVVLKDKEKQVYLAGIINDLNFEKGLDYQTPIVVDSKITQKYLKDIGFEWPIVDFEYIRKVIQYIEKVEYL